MSDMSDSGGEGEGERVGEGRTCLRVGQSKEGRLLYTKVEHETGHVDLVDLVLLHDRVHGHQAACLCRLRKEGERQEQEEITY